MMISILSKIKILDSSVIKYLKKLEKYRNIFKNGERWQLRVPLFEQWIQRHGE